jgi:predicted RNA-binding protein YlqC (UPF0109 family)
VNRIEVVTGVLNSVVQLIVSLPKQARITTRMTSDGAGREVVCFEIDVHESDRGKLIGKGGANMRALRVLLNSAGYLSGARYRVNCKDETQAQQVSVSARIESED